jgi:hypothetical protein
MKAITFVGALMVLAFAIMGACCKPKPVSSCKEGYTKAIITGYDMRKCACCGGLMITFSNDDKPYSSDFVLVNSLPTGTTINESSKFPMSVCIKYEKLESPCGMVKLRVTNLIVNN